MATVDAATVVTAAAAVPAPGVPAAPVVGTAARADDDEQTGGRGRGRGVQGRARPRRAGPLRGRDRVGQSAGIFVPTMEEQAHRLSLNRLNIW